MVEASEVKFGNPDYVAVLLLPHSLDLLTEKQQLMNNPSEFYAFAKKLNFLRGKGERRAYLTFTSEFG